MRHEMEVSFNGIARREAMLVYLHMNICIFTL